MRQLKRNYGAYSSYLAVVAVVAGRTGLAPAASPPSHSCRNFSMAAVPPCDTPSQDGSCSGHSCYEPLTNPPLTACNQPKRIAWLWLGSIEGDQEYSVSMLSPCYTEYVCQKTYWTRIENPQQFAPYCDPQSGFPTALVCETTESYNWKGWKQIWVNLTLPCP
jgi:hypothetical protein